MANRSLNIYSSNGACPNKSGYREFTPCNTAYIFGNVGESVIVSVGTGGSFVENSRNTAEITIGKSGYKTLDVSSVVNGPLTVSAYNPQDGIRNALATSTFLEPKPGGDYIDLYSSTTGVPSDGLSTAKIYLYISSMLNSTETNYVQVAVTNNANIVNCNDQSTGEIPVPPSGQLQVSITSIYPGTKKVYFHVKNLPLTTPLSVDIEFIDIGVL